MKKLDTKVNIIPIIAKADTINKTELSKFKSKIMSELVNNGVQIYQFPTEDDTVAPTNKGKFFSKVKVSLVISTTFEFSRQNTMLQKISKCEVKAKNEFLQVETLSQFEISAIHLPLIFV